MKRTIDEAKEEEHATINTTSLSNRKNEGKKEEVKDKAKQEEEVKREESSTSEECGDLGKFLQHSDCALHSMSSSSVSMPVAGTRVTEGAENHDREHLAMPATSDPVSNGAENYDREDLAMHLKTGHLLAKMSNRGLTEDNVQDWIEEVLKPRIKAFTRHGGVVRYADLDFSFNHLTHRAVAVLLAAWDNAGMSCPLILKLHNNALTAAVLPVISSFCARNEGILRELHLGSNPILSREALVQFLRKLGELARYSRGVWIKRHRRCAPLYLRIDRCGIVEPALLVDEARLLSLRVCLMPGDPSRCTKSTCAVSAFGSDANSCPMVHLHHFLNQELEVPNVPENVTDGLCSTGSVPGEELASGSPGQRLTRERERGRLYLCGQCNRDLPLDMFGRYQFKKAAQLDAISSEQSSYLIRRCNDCVQQPCSACHQELPLTAFARGQMLRPKDDRRCRECAAFTYLCSRCGQPKPPREFSPLEVGKRKIYPKVCSDCLDINPYFERRFTMALVLGGRKASDQHGLPILPQEVVQRIAAFAEPGDRFTRVERRNFSCSLCAKTWSLLTNDIERHVRHCDHHKSKKKALANGHLLLIEDTGLELERFRCGLGIKGIVCTPQQVKEARDLLHVSELMNRGISMDALKGAGLTARHGDWVPPHVLVAVTQIGGDESDSSGPAAAPSISWMDVGGILSDPTLAARQTASQRHKLFGHLQLDEGDEEAREELEQLRAMLDSN